jgi:hypothetical protein
MAFLARIGADRDHIDHQYQLWFIAFRSKAARAGKKWPFDLHFAQDTWCCNSSSRGAPFLIFGGPRRADPARSIQPLISEGTPLEKKRPPRPGQGQRPAPDRRGHRRVTHGPPLTTPLAGCPPQVHTTAREAKKQPSSAPGCSHRIA